MSRWVVSAVLLSGCPGPAGETNGDSDPSETTTGADTTSSSTGTAETHGSTDNGATGAADSTGSDPIECDVFGGDCPDGEKCLPWAPSADEPYTGTRCVPAGDKDEGEACQVEQHPLSGLDDCVAEAVCWHVDPVTLQGQCVRRCQSDTVEPGCDLPCNALCTIGSELAPPLCLPPCNPLAQDCEDGFTCVAADTHFVCVLDRSGAGGAMGEPCSGIDTCDPGLFCLSALAWPDCEGPGGCCAPACDVTAMDSCADAPPMTECVAWYGPDNAPDNTMCTPFDQIGVCALP